MLGAKNHKFISSIMLVFVLALTALSVFAASDAAYAENNTGGSAMPWESGLDKIRKSLSGPVAMAISVIAIVAAGAMLIFGGDIQGFMRTATYLALVIGIVICANNLIGNLYDTSAYISFVG